MSVLREHTLDDAPRPRRAPEQRVPVSTGVRGGAGRRGGQGAARAPGAAVVKVMPYRHSARETVATLAYVMQKADRVEDDLAADVEAPEAVRGEWELPERDGRVAAHVLFSLPNRDPEAEWAAATEAVRECFPNSPYVCALHTDTENPHVHVVVRMRDYDGKKLRIGREDLYDFRRALARAGRERGIAVEARRYSVPTRLRDRLRVFSKAEPLSRRLDRHIAVLQRPADATPAQLRKACKAIGRHHKEMHDGHRRGVLRAVSQLEKYPRLQRPAKALCKLAFKGPRGDRFVVRQRRRDNVKTLATAEPGSREVGRAATRLAKEVGDLAPAERLALRAQVASGAGEKLARPVAKVEKALDRTAGSDERRRVAIDRAIGLLKEPSRHSARVTRTATRLLVRYRKHMHAGDRLTLRRDVLSCMAAMAGRERQSAALAALAKRPRTLRQAVAETARTVARVVQRRARRQEVSAPAEKLQPRPRPSKVQRQKQALGRAVDALASPPAADPGATRRALWTLARHHGLLTNQHREQLLGHLQRWQGTTPANEAERLSIGRYQRVAARILRHGEDGRAFDQRHRIEENLATLRRDAVEPQPVQQVKEAAVVLRKDLIALNARQRAEARAQAARLGQDATKARPARKLAKALDKTATNRERAEQHLARAMKTLGNLSAATRRERRHAAKVLARLHPFLSREQRATLSRHAARLARNPRHARAAKAFRRIAEMPPPQRKRAPRQR